MGRVKLSPFPKYESLCGTGLVPDTYLVMGIELQISLKHVMCPPLHHWRKACPQHASLPVLWPVSSHVLFFPWLGLI